MASAPLVVASHPEGPYSAKGLGEMVICGHAPALRAAVRDAIGVWLYNMPMIPERVLKALRKQGINK